MGPIEYAITSQMLSGYLGICLMLAVFGVAYTASDPKFWSDMHAKHLTARKSHLRVHMGDEQDKTAKRMQREDRRW